MSSNPIASAIFIRQSPDYSGLCRFWAYDTRTEALITAQGAHCLRWYAHHRNRLRFECVLCSLASRCRSWKGRRSRADPTEQT